MENNRYLEDFKEFLNNDLKLIDEINYDYEHFRTIRIIDILDSYIETAKGVVDGIKEEEIENFLNSYRMSLDSYNNEKEEYKIWLIELIDKKNELEEQVQWYYDFLDE